MYFLPHYTRYFFNMAILLSFLISPVLWAAEVPAWARGLWHRAANQAEFDCDIDAFEMLRFAPEDAPKSLSYLAILQPPDQATSASLILAYRNSSYWRYHVVASYSDARGVLYILDPIRPNKVFTYTDWIDEITHRSPHAQFRVVISTRIRERIYISRTPCGKINFATPVTMLASHESGDDASAIPAVGALELKVQQEGIMRALKVATTAMEAPITMSSARVHSLVYLFPMFAWPFQRCGRKR